MPQYLNSVKNSVKIVLICFDLHMTAFLHNYFMANEKLYILLDSKAQLWNLALFISVTLTEINIKQRQPLQGQQPQNA
jgi:hypothetical protein